MAVPVIKPGSPPIDAPLPSTGQKLINFVAAYLQIDGLGDLQGIIISDTEPVATDRDKAWIKLDAGSGRAIGLYRYLGGWVAVPVVIGNGEAEPAGAIVGELFFNTISKTLKIYTVDGWSNELWHTGTTVQRPTVRPVGYVFFDTTISRLIRWTAAGWSTIDGCIGELRMFDGLTVAEAAERNPGWALFAAMSGKFPMGFEEGETAIGATGGRNSFPFSASGGKNNASSGSEYSMNGLTIDTKSVGGSGALVNYAGATTTMNGTVDITPPFKAVIFMRKEY